MQDAGDQQLRIHRWRGLEQYRRYAHSCDHVLNHCIQPVPRVCSRSETTEVLKVVKVLNCDEMFQFMARVEENEGSQTQSCG